MSGNDTFSITVGVDGLAESRLALEWAVGEARLRHGRVRAVTAWEYPPATVGMEGLRWDPDIFERVARTTQTDVLRRVDAEGIPVTDEVTQGPAATVLLKGSKDADLIVVGSRGLGGFTGLLLTRPASKPPVRRRRSRPQSNGIKVSAAGTSTPGWSTVGPAPHPAP